MSVPPGYLSNAELAANVQQQTEEIKQFKDEQTNLYTTQSETATVTNAEGVPVGVPSWKKVSEANTNADAALVAVGEMQVEVASLGDDVEAIRDGQVAGQLVYRTWSELSAVTGSVGEGAQVISDAGTHTDPVVGGTVANAGQYLWSESPAGWRWVRADGLALKADRSVVDPMVPVVARVGAAVKVRSWPGVMFGVTDADGRATWIQASDVDGRMAPYTEWVLRQALGLFMRQLPGLSAAVTMRDEDGREWLTDLSLRPDGQFPDFVVRRLAQRISSELNIAADAGIPQTELYSLDGQPAPVLTNMAVISGWGSSSTEGSASAMSAVASELGAVYYNGGKGGEIAQQTIARLGAVPALLSFPGDVIPTSGAVTVTSTNLPTRGNLRPYYGRVNGVRGQLTSNSTEITFTRDGSGDEVSVSPNSPFIPDEGHARRNGVLLIWVGKNNFSSTEPGKEAEVIAATMAAWNYGEVLFRRRIVLGHFADTNTPSGSMERAQILAANADYAARYGSSFLDVYSYITSPEVWADTGITPTSTDLAQQAIGNKPPSLSSDVQHFNAAGYNAIARLLKKRMLDLGWYKINDEG